MAKKRIHLIYSILVSVSAVIAGICLIAACVKLYNFQPGSFSRESVAQAFRPIAVWVYICLALAVGGILFNIISPADPKKLQVQKQYGTILANLQKKVDIFQCDPALFKAILRQQNSRKIHTIISYVLLALFGSIALSVCSMIIIYYAREKTNEMNEAVILAMMVFLPYLFIPFGYGIFVKYFKKHSIAKEIELMKKALAEGAAADSLPAQPAAEKGTGIKIIRYAILGIAIAIFVGGFIFGGTADVLAKAAAICTECVGLG